MWLGMMEMKQRWKKIWLLHTNLKKCSLTTSSLSIFSQSSFCFTVDIPNFSRSTENRYSTQRLEARYVHLLGDWIPSVWNWDWGIDWLTDRIGIKLKFSSFSFLRFLLLDFPLFSVSSQMSLWWKIDKCDVIIMCVLIKSEILCMIWIYNSLLLYIT